jgi:hypothetical protein
MMYVATTPFMPADNKGDPVVHELNARALAVVTARGIPFIDLYTRVTDKCGDLYTNCSICAVSRLPVHLATTTTAQATGYEWIAAPLVAATSRTLLLSQASDLDPLRSEFFNNNNNNNNRP